MKRSRPVSLALVGLLLWVTGCTTWQQISIGELPDHDKVRVTLADGERIILAEEEIAADSIYIWSDAESGAHFDKVRVTYPLNRVTLFEAQKVSVPMTVLATLMIAGVASLIILDPCIPMPFAGCED